LRHAHASWLLAGGANLQVVKERLGQRSIRATERYLHTLPEAQEAALAALDAVRGNRNSARQAGLAGQIAHEEVGVQANVLDEELAQLRGMVARFREILGPLGSTVADA
jgi:hypothetical protein